MKLAMLLMAVAAVVAVTESAVCETCLLDPLMFDEPLRLELITQQNTKHALAAPPLSFSRMDEGEHIRFRTEFAGFLDRIPEEKSRVTIDLSMNGGVTYNFLPKSKAAEHEAAVALRDALAGIPTTITTAASHDTFDHRWNVWFNEVQETVLARLSLQPLPFVASLVVSCVGTIYLMFVIVRRTKETTDYDDTTVAAPAQLPSAQNHAGPEINVEAILLQAKRILHDKKSATRISAVSQETAQESEDVLEMAKTFGRGQGEVRLAQAVEASNRQNARQRKLQQLEEVAEMNEPMASVKKLGVGRGELELAKSLRRLRENNTVKGS